MYMPETKGMKLVLRTTGVNRNRVITDSMKKKGTRVNPIRGFSAVFITFRGYLAAMVFSSRWTVRIIETGTEDCRCHLASAHPCSVAPLIRDLFSIMASSMCKS